MKILLLPLALSSAQVSTPLKNQRPFESPGLWIVFQDMSAFSCGDTTSASQFYFVSPAYPVSDS